jgi:predicted enzyme related to lactoylglutathione lyase
LNNRVVHFEIPAENPQRLTNFYEELFGWKIEKAEASKLGARVTVGKQAVPGMGWFAHIADLEGNPLGIWQNDERAGS